MPDATLTITGNLPADPELRFTQSGTPVVSFTVMQNKREKDQAGNWNETAKNGMRVTAWRDLAQNISESFQKGQRVIVTGRLEPRQWQDKNTGENRYDWQLIADDAGHALKYATSQAVKNQRNQQQPQQGPQQGYGQPSQQGHQQPPANDPWGAPQENGGIPF